jgi:hypothetical protein
MSNLAHYFENKAYKPKWSIGDRVFGYWNKIPFVGSVGNDRYISDVIGPEITVHLDLPIKYKDNVHRIIIVKHKDIKEYK